MRHCFTKLILAAVFTGWSMHAQDVNRFIGEANQAYNQVKDYILKSAEEMPAESYEFRPTPGSQTFGQLIQAIARSQDDICSSVAGTNLQGNGPSYESKAHLIEALKKSIGTCDSAYASVSALNANQEVGFGSMRHSKLGLLFLNAARDNECYGHLEVYLRLKGFLPPSKRPRLVPLD